MSAKSSVLLSIISIIIAVLALWKAYTPDNEALSMPNNIGAQVEAAIQENPEMILKAITSLTKKQEQKAMGAQKDELLKNKKAVFEAANDPTAGNPDGDVTLVEFFDYRCGYCRRAYGPLQDAVKTDGKVKIIYKEFPIFGGKPLMTQAALAAHKQGRYDDFHKALMNSTGQLDQKDLDVIAEKLGLDVAKLQADMHDPAMAAEIEKNMEVGRAMGINATPTLIIGSEIYPGFLNVEQLHEAFKKART